MSSCLARVIPIALAMPVALATSARADGPYVSDGIGPAHLGGKLGERAGGFSPLAGRGSIGVCESGFCVGVGVTSFHFTDLDGADMACDAFGFDVEWQRPLAGRFETYLRGGVGRAYIRLTDGPLRNHEGPTINYGAGLSWRFIRSVDHGVPTKGRIWIEVTRENIFLQSLAGEPLPGDMTMVALGFTIATDY